MKPNGTHPWNGPSRFSTDPRRPRPSKPQPAPGPRRFQQNVVGAGSVVFRRRGRNVQIFFVKNAYGRWTFPKGKQDLGEALAETAVRETREEAGLTGLRLVAPLGRTTFRFQRDGQYVQKTVHFFLFEAPADAQEKMTGVEGGMWEAMWVPIHRAIIINGYRNLDLLLSKAIRLISVEERRRHSGAGSMPRLRHGS